MTIIYNKSKSDNKDFRVFLITVRFLTKLSSSFTSNPIVFSSILMSNPWSFSSTVLVMLCRIHWYNSVLSGCWTVSLTREGSEPSMLLVALPSVTVENCPLQLEMCLPAHGWVRTPLPVAYLVYNHTQSLLTLSLNIEPSEAFMFAGHKQVISCTFKITLFCEWCSFLLCAFRLFVENKHLHWFQVVMVFEKVNNWVK